MARRYLHHDAAVEHFLRERRVPYVAVDEARRTLLPMREGIAPPTVKSFDFLVTLPGMGLLVEVKGRTWKAGRTSGAGLTARPGGALESWATLDDVEGLRTWQRLMGGGFRSALVFVYLCDREPPDTVFDEAFEFRARWYGLRAVLIDEYAARMRPRSERWRTVDVSAAAFAQLRLRLDGAGFGPGMARTA